MKIRPKTFFVAIIVCLLIALLLWPINIEHTKPKHIKIVTTIFPAYDFARTISANTDVSLKLLIKPGVDLHNYEPTPQDIINIKESDIFIYNGGESEKWVEKIIADINQSTDVIRMMDLVQLKIESDEHSDEHSDALDYDEHIWTSPKNVIKISSAIANTIANRTPNNATTVRRNYDRFKSSLKKLKLSGTCCRQNRHPGCRRSFPISLFCRRLRLRLYCRISWLCGTNRGLTKNYRQTYRKG